MRINIENACSCDIPFDLLVWEESREIKTYAYRFEFEEFNSRRSYVEYFDCYLLLSPSTQ